MFRGDALANPFHAILRLSVGDFVAKTLNFLAFVYLARLLGANTFGVLEFANALLTYFLLFADAGLEIWSTREAARMGDVRELAGRVLPMRFLMALAVFVALCAGIPLLPPYPQLPQLSLLFGLSIFAQSVSLKWVFMGRQQMTRVAAGLVVSQIVFAVSVFLFVRRVEHVLLVPVLKFASDFALSGFFAWRFHAEHGGLRLPLRLSRAWEILHPALVFGATNALGLLNYNLASILLGFLTSAQVVGWYAAAYKPVTISLALPLTYFIGLFPVLSALYHESRERFVETVRRSVHVCAILAVPLGVGGTLLAPEIIGFLFGPQYSESVLPFRILIWSAVSVIIRGSYRHSINAAGLQHLELRTAIVSASVNLGMNLALIPKFGMVGSACATVLSDATWFAMACYFFQRHIQPLSPLPLLLRPAIAAALMGLLLWLAPPVHWMARVAGGGLAYFVILFLLGEPVLREWLGKLRSRTSA